MTCPQPYSWREERNGDRTCSHCGSLHPEDFLDIMYKFAAGEPGYEWEPTDKGYKFYARRAGVKNAAEGGIKFYAWHDEGYRDEIVGFWPAVVAKYQLWVEERRARWTNGSGATSG